MGKDPAPDASVHIDLEDVEKLCGLQCTDEELASFLGVSVSDHRAPEEQPAFAEAMARGKAKGRFLYAELMGAGSEG